MSIPTFTITCGCTAADCDSKLSMSLLVGISGQTPGYWVTIVGVENAESVFIPTDKLVDITTWLHSN